MMVIAFLVADPIDTFGGGVRFKGLGHIIDVIGKFPAAAFGRVFGFAGVIGIVEVIGIGGGVGFFAGGFEFFVFFLFLEGFFEPGPAHFFGDDFVALGMVHVFIE